MNSFLYQYILMLGDSSMILGHRLSELCGHGPSLETDIALTNISLDLFGQVRNYFQYAAELHGEQTEDDVAFLRLPHEYKNVLLVERPNTDFAHVIARQFFYDTYHLLLMEKLSDSTDKRLSAIAQKSIKEVRYHYRFSSEWMKRLGDGTEISKQKMQDAVNELYRFTGELFEATPIEVEMAEQGFGPNITELKAEYDHRIHSIIDEARLTLPETPWHQSGGKKGIHGEHLGYILADLQYMQRAYPNMQW